MGQWSDKADSDAQDALLHCEDEILEQLVDDEECSTDFSDYDDTYHHENHVDRAYNLEEAAELLDELDEYEETDSGLWEGCDVRRALTTCAAFTYGHAVYAEITRLLESINDDFDTEYDEDDHIVYVDEDEIEEDDEATEEARKTAKKQLAQEVFDRYARD